jgi:hypothetical protein
MKESINYPMFPIVINKQLNKSIGYFGDSFCANSTNEESYCNIVARSLGCGVISHFGVGSSSIWHMFFSFMEMKKQNKLPDNIVIVYTNPDRFYHPEKALPMWALSEKSETPLEHACDMYIKHLHCPELNKFQHKACIEWFDQNVLKPLTSNHNIVQIFAFDKFDIEINSSPLLDYNLMPLYQKCKDDGLKDNVLYNHMSKEQNQKVASDLLDKLIRNS